MPERDAPDRVLISALPLPLAQAWRRTLYAETPAAEHQRAFYTLEATLKYVASVAAASWMRRGAPGPAARRACEAIVRVSVGHWAAILRDCTAALPENDPARRWLAATLATPIASTAPGLDGRNVGAVLDGIPAYRNTVIGHAAGLSDKEAAERAPAIVELTRDILKSMVSHNAPVLVARSGNVSVALTGPTAVLHDGDGCSGALNLSFDAEQVELFPLWLFDAEDDDVLVINKGAGLAKVEYLSYGSPRGSSGQVVFKGPPAESLKHFLEVVTGKTQLAASDIASLAEEADVRELASRVTAKRYGSYKVVRQIASGGQGILYEAIQEDPPRRVALKTLTIEAALMEDSRRRLREEGEALARVEHPNVVPVYASGADDGVPWIAMKFVEGKSLAEIIDALRGHAGPVTFAEWTAATSSSTERAPAARTETHDQRVARLGRDAARALAACHARALVHRDVKPGNIMIDSDGRVILTDFGLARSIEARAQTFTRRWVGTPQYLAPEALLPTGREGPDARVDVYGLGATLYEALSLRPPFAEYAQDERALLHAVQTKEPRTLRRMAPWVPRELETIVMKAMEKDRDRRYPTAAAFADDLDRYLNGEPILARPAGIWTRARKWSRRHPGKTASMVAALLLVVGGTLLLQAEVRRRRDRAQHIARIEQVLAGDDRVVNVQLRADNFQGAERTLDETIGSLAGEQDAELLARRQSLEAQRDRLHRVVAFYRRADDAWFRAGEENDEEAVEAGEQALQSLGILDSHDNWWEKLPAEDLSANQHQELQQEAYRQLILLCAMRTKPGLNQLRVLNRKQAAVHFQEALIPLELAVRLRTSRTSQVLGLIDVNALRVAGAAPSDEIVARFGQPQAPPRGGVIVGEDPTDYFFLGLVNFFIGKFPQDPMSRIGTALVLRGVTDLDSRAPLPTAERLFRASVQLDASRYWPHFMLGWTLATLKDYPGAELAFGTCISLRPENARGYEQRALVLYRESLQREKPLQKQLRAEALADSDRALRLSPDDPSTYWSRGDLLVLLGRDSEALPAFARAFELEEKLLEKLSRRDHLNEVERYAKKEIKTSESATDPAARLTNARAWLLLALVDWTEGKAAQALESTERVLANAPAEGAGASTRGEALAVRGSVLLKRGKPEDAERAFEEAVRLAPDSFLAAVGKARALEKLGQHEQALGAYDEMLTASEAKNSPLVLAPWQKVAAHLGKARALRELGQSKDADVELEHAKMINPQAKEEVEQP